ncbi:MAG: exodeoxyribonuclease V subunit gamma [Kiritimatiellae bacterium]|nr:exodeoxyribonuclease V subunit gamma [Kiritimatiellia bacterium]
MSLKIYYSDRIEDLSAHLKDALVASRAGTDPFVFPQITVPNPNIAKWLKLRVFAKERALCAGVSFPFIEQRLASLMAANLPKGTAFSLLPMNAYSVAVMSSLLASKGEIAEFDLLAPLRAYVSGTDGKEALEPRSRREARMAWQLAVKTAELLDQYEVKRPEIVAGWLAGGGGEGGDVEKAEAALARLLWGPDGAFPPDGERLSLRQLYDRVSSAPPAGPAETIFFFGHSTLSLLQVKILAWLARTHEVVFYHNNVCLEYWGDIESREERIRRLGSSHENEEDIPLEDDNPLLRQWGAAGRETMRLLVSLEEECGGETLFEWKDISGTSREKPRSILAKIQQSICRRTAEVEKSPQDASLQIAGAPGMRREVEMVYNAIIGSVWKPEGSGERPWPDCTFSDMALLVPDMAAYRPVIEEVFDARGDVPYALADTTAAEDSVFLAGFAAIADLARQGLSRDTLFAVVDNPCFQKAMSFTPEDAARWREITVQIGAFDGFERRDDDDVFSWEWALSRLRLASVADALSLGASAEEMPLSDLGDDSALRFSETVELLCRKVREAFFDGGRSRVLPCAVDSSAGEWRLNWAFVLGRLMDDLLAVPDDSALENDVRRHIVQSLNSLSSLPGEHGFEIPLAAVERFAGGIACRKGGYLTHGVTIASLQPMRPVPFKQIFVLGLGADGFPGRTSSSTLDIRGSRWRLGDVSLPKINRYLFLETLMSARDRLVLTYPDRDIEKDARLYPAGIVRELEEFASVVAGKRFSEFSGCSLLERGEGALPGPSPVCGVTWDRSDPHAGLLPTYSAAARSLARALAVARSAERGEKKAASALMRFSSDACISVSARDLADFLKSPLRAVLARRFGISVEEYADRELENDSPLGIASNAEKRELEDAYLADAGVFDGRFRVLQLEGRARAGFIGEFEKRSLASEFAAAAEDVRSFAESFGAFDGSSRMSALRVPVEIDCGGKTLKVRFTSEIPCWKETDGGVTVLVKGYVCGRSEKRVPDGMHPVEAALEAFVAFLMSLVEKGGGASRHLAVGVMDPSRGRTACWEWDVEPGEARRYLENLARRYLGFLDTAGERSAYVDFPFGKLAKALDRNSACDWNGILSSLSAEEWTGGKKKNSFNGSLVVERALEECRRYPSAEELEELFGMFYELPMSGKLRPSKKGGAA